VGSGLLARMRRPENRTGVLMMLVGFAWFGGALTAADQSLPYTIGYVEGALIGAFFVHLVLAFPSGRLETKTERRVTTGIYVFALVLQPALLLFDDLHGLKCDACPENAFLVDRTTRSPWSSGFRRSLLGRHAERVTGEALFHRSPERSPRLCPTTRSFPGLKQQRFAAFADGSRGARSHGIRQSTLGRYAPV
jgi:hypothetical protein